MSAVIENHHDDHHHGPDKGLMRWVLTTNHKDIGSLYLWFSFAMFLVGGCMALVIRAELFQPGLQLVAPEFFNQMTTCLLYTSPSPRDLSTSRMPSSA